MRQIDQLGRVVLPVEWRRQFMVEPGAPLEIIPGRDGTLMLQRYVPGGACTFCGSFEGVRHFAGRPVCRDCVVSMVDLVQT
ncbi:MAG TPA: AbrB/MazE/SpoVT family DNA-binding domain-containing protein [Symbiobacteriaceae bacterium]|nr:AbrB/MazE/SpoVT family DNA-binding domain-containing protein [Symbiobacteriaceae bacterium]